MRCSCLGETFTKYNNSPISTNPNLYGYPFMGGGLLLSFGPRGPYLAVVRSGGAGFGPAQSGRIVLNPKIKREILTAMIRSIGGVLEPFEAGISTWPKVVPSIVFPGHKLDVDKVAEWLGQISLNQNIWE
jgi:hypothetical protein